MISISTNGDGTTARYYCYRLLSVVALLLLIRELYFQQLKSVDAPKQLRRGQVPDHTKLFSPDNKHYTEGTIKLPGIDPETPVLTLNDLKDLANTTRIGPPDYWEDALQQRLKAVEVLEKAGVKINLELLQRLPAWRDVVKLYGAEPVILGRERCAEFRRAHPKDRTAAIAGQFNTGTNAMAMYFGQNLRMPGSNYGFMANVPWHKHGWLDLRGKYEFKPPKNVDQVLPVVITRDPYGWFHSMCESPYLLNGNWTGDNCPNLLDSTRTSVPAKLHLGKQLQHKKVWDSLVHVWSEWYGEYYDTELPRLIIRFEDILFHTPKVMDAIRSCVGGVWANDEFVYQTASSKGGKKYFEDIKPQSSMISAIIKYGQDPTGRRTNNMTDADLKFVRRHLDQRLMEAFHYKHPDEM